MSHEHLALVVDDDEEILEEVEAILSSLGHRCERATNQVEAETLFQRRSFCYLLLDLHLPPSADHLARVETGFNILKRIRQDHPKDELPIIIMTAHGKETEICTRAFKLGATDYITKPFEENKESLEEKIEAALRATCEARHPSCPNLGGANGGSRRHTVRKTTESAISRAASSTSSGRRATDHRPVIKFVGKMKDKLCLLQIDERWDFVTMTTFSCFWRLAVALLENPSGGWVNLGRNGSKNKYRVLKEVREKLRVRLDFQRDGYGKYRLPTVPDKIEFDAGIMAANHPKLFELLPLHFRS